VFSFWQIPDVELGVLAHKTLFFAVLRGWLSASVWLCILTNVQVPFVWLRSLQLINHEME